MYYVRKFLAHPSTVAAVMAIIGLGVVFEYLNWSAEQVGAVETTLAMWFLIANDVVRKEDRRTYDAELKELAASTTP